MPVPAQVRLVRIRLTRETVRRLTAVDPAWQCSDTALCGPTRLTTTEQADAVDPAR